MLYCLEEGNALLPGSVSPPDEPATAILSEPPALDHPNRQNPPFGDPGAGGQFVGEPQTAIRSEPGAVATGFGEDEEKTRVIIHTTQAEAEPQESIGSVAERQSPSANRAAQPWGKVGNRQRLLLALDDRGIKVADYWTQLPDKKLLERNCTKP